MKKACKSDNYHDTIDWAKLKNITQELIENEHFELVERMAETLAQRFFAFSSKIKKIEICIEKTEGWKTGSRGVCIKRKRLDYGLQK